MSTWTQPNHLLCCAALLDWGWSANQHEHGLPRGHSLGGTHWPGKHRTSSNLQLTRCHEVCHNVRAHFVSWDQHYSSILDHGACRASYVPSSSWPQPVDLCQASVHSSCNVQGFLQAMLRVVINISTALWSSKPLQVCGALCWISCLKQLCVQCYHGRLRLTKRYSLTFSYFFSKNAC